MSEFKGTKGKWVYHGRGLVLNENYIAHKEDKKLHIRCDILPIEKYCREEIEANALLISKAPEMLEMLQRIMKTYDKGTQTYLDCQELIKQATKI